MHNNVLGATEEKKNYKTWLWTQKSLYNLVTAIRHMRTYTELYKQNDKAMPHTWLRSKWVLASKINQV